MNFDELPEIDVDEYNKMISPDDEKVNVLPIKNALTKELVNEVHEGARNIACYSMYEERAEKQLKSLVEAVKNGDQSKATLVEEFAKFLQLLDTKVKEHLEKAEKIKKMAYEHFLKGYFPESAEEDAAKVHNFIMHESFTYIAKARVTQIISPRDQELEKLMPRV